MHEILSMFETANATAVGAHLDFDLLFVLGVGVIGLEQSSELVVTKKADACTFHNGLESRLLIVAGDMHAPLTCENSYQ